MENISGGKDKCAALTKADLILTGVGVGLYVAATIFTGGIAGAILGAFAASTDVAGYGMLAGDVACAIAA